MNFSNVLENLDNYCKQKHYKRPKYKIVFIDGKVYKKLYEMSVEIKGVLTVTEKGISRRIAEKKAAFKALNQLKIINNEVVDTEDEEVVNETNDDIDDKLRSEQQLNDTYDDEEDQKKVDISYADTNPESDLEDESINNKNTIILNSTPNVVKVENDLKLYNEVTDTEEDVINKTNNITDVKLRSEQFNDEEYEKVVDMSDVNIVDISPEIDVEDNQKFGNTILSNSTPNVVKVKNELKLNNENLNPNKSTPNTLKNEFIDQSQGSIDLEPNPINGLFKYCLRKSIAFPSYHFDFNDNMFCTECRLQYNGTEYFGVGKSNTMNESKIIASQEVIDELKSKNLFFEYNMNESQLEENDYNLSSGFNQRFENKFKEYPKVTINMMSTEPKIIGTKTENIPIVRDLEDSDDEFDGKNEVPFAPTPEDAIQRLQEVEGILRKKQEILEKKRNKVIEISQKNSSKNKSLETLKHKEQIDKQLDQIKAMLAGIKYQRQAIQNRIINTEVVKIMKEADQILEQTNNYLDIEFENLMDELREQEQFTQEISQILSNSIGNVSEVYNNSHSSTIDDNNNPTKRQFNSLNGNDHQNYHLIIDNPIEYLQEYCAKNKLKSPNYEKEVKSVPEHIPLYTYKCTLELKERRIIGIGLGNNKKEAKKASAEEVIRLWLKS